MLTMKHLCLVGALALWVANSAGAQTVAVPPLYYQPGPALKSLAEAALLTPDAAQPYAISLPAPTLKEMASFKFASTAGVGSEKAARGQKGAPLKIGYM